MPSEFELVPGRWIGGSHPCFIIAEIGQNHQGDINIAKSMVEAAKECGADCVKFQKSNLHHKFTLSALQRPYKGPHSWGETYGEHKRHLELSEDNFRDLKSHCEKVGIPFTASGMDHKSIDFLNELQVPFLKIGSGDTNNFPLVVRAAQTGKPLIISSGMQSMETMQKLYFLIKPINDKFCFLQCTSCYPTNPKDVNLRVIQTFQREFSDVPIGYSGHEEGICISVAAVAMGAKVVERHLTLDKTLKGNDHRSSLIPIEFQEMVTNIRIVEHALGQHTKTMLPCEFSCYNKLGKSVVAACNVTKGSLISEESLTIKVAEPKGLSPQEMSLIVGKMAAVDIAQDESIHLHQLQ